MHPALKKMIDEANQETEKMIRNTIQSGQVQMLANRGWATQIEAEQALKPFSTFIVVKNIAGRFVHI